MEMSRGDWLERRLYGPLLVLPLAELLLVTLAISGGQRVTDASLAGHTRRGALRRGRVLAAVAVIGVALAVVQGVGVIDGGGGVDVNAAVVVAPAFVAALFGRAATMAYRCVLANAPVGRPISGWERFWLGRPDRPYRWWGQGIRHSVMAVALVGAVYGIVGLIAVEHAYKTGVILSLSAFLVGAAQAVALTVDRRYRRASVPARSSREATAVVWRSGQLAEARGERSRPVHLLAALAEMDGPVAGVLRGSDGGLVGLASDMAPGGGQVPPGYVARQTISAATWLAYLRRETCGPEHLLLAVIDQGDPEAIASLDAFVDVGEVRAATLGLIGAPGGLPPIAMPPLMVARTGDRPALLAEQLDETAWRVLCWRQAHMPVSRLETETDCRAVMYVEQRAVHRVADRLGLDDDQRYSLLARHRHQIQTRFSALAIARTKGPVVKGKRSRFRRSWQRRAPYFMSGWPEWCSRKRRHLHDRYFWITTVHAYRGQPDVTPAQLPRH